MIEFGGSSGKVLIVIEKDEVECIRNLLGSMSVRELRLYVEPSEVDLLCSMFHDAEYLLKK